MSEAVGRIAGSPTYRLLVSCLNPNAARRRRERLTRPLTGMMDQLASVGVEFDEATIARIFSRLERYYRDTAINDAKAANETPAPANGDDPEEVLARITASAGEPPEKPSNWGWFERFRPVSLHWAVDPIYQKNVPVRPWGLGAIKKAESFFYKLAGSIIRSPEHVPEGGPQHGQAD